jgi:iron complex outermembrane recepter protein
MKARKQQDVINITVTSASKADALLGAIRPLVSALLLVCASFLPQATLAQQASVETASDEDNPEIIVTAQRRAERLQDVPLSVAVLNYDQMQAFGQNATTDLAYRVPNVTINNGASARQFGFFIRGYGSTSFAPETIESSTAFVLDGVVLGQAGGALMDLPDLERVEVLRGPQGTLFGKNSGAGVINVTTRTPSRDKFLGEARVSTAFPDFERKISLYASGPIGEEAAFSISGRVNKRDGHIKNLFDGREFNGDNNYGARARVDVEPSSNFKLTVTGDWWERDADCCIFTIARPSTTPTAVEIAQRAGGVNIRKGNFTQNLDGYVFSDVYSRGVSVGADYDFNDHTLTSISAFRLWGSCDGIDLDSQPTNIFNINDYCLKQQQFTQELRITSPTGKFIDYVFGLFYFNQTANGAGSQRITGSTALRANRDYAVDGRTENVAGFGQANINLTEDFRLIAGMRLLKENINVARRQFDPVNVVTANIARERSDDSFVWRLGAQYDITSDVNIFATATRGFKGGGFDTGPTGNTATDVLPERPTSYEAGLRSVWRDAGLTFNVTGFWQTIKDLQISGRDPNNTLNFFLLNAATARTRGGEWELSFRPSRDLDLTFDLAGAYTDATFRSFPLSPCYRGQTAALGCVGGVQNLAGAPLPLSEKWSGNLTTTLVLPIGNDLKLTPAAFVGYKSKANMGSVNDPSMVQKGYPLINLSLAIGDEDDRWTARAFVRNLTDEVFTTRVISTIFGGAGGYSEYYTYDAQRVIGVSAEFSF